MTTSKDASMWLKNSKSYTDAPNDDTLPEIHSIDLINPPKLRPELISGVLRVGHKMMLSGPSKAGKTFCLIQLAAAIATGGKWMGIKCVKGRVLYIDFELDPASFTNRVARVARANEANTTEVMEALDVWNLRGHSRQLNELLPVIESKAAGNSYSAVILDPIYKINGGDENSAQDVSRFCNALDRLATSLNCSVIYCHHHSKGAQGNKSSTDRASGSGVFSRDADAIVDMVELVPNEEQEASLNIGPDVTMWRVSFTLRDFAPRHHINVFFEYPYHRPEAKGELEELSPMTSSQKGGRTMAERNKLDKAARIRAFNEELHKEWVENGAQPISLKRACELSGTSINTTKGYIDMCNGFKRVNPDSKTALVVPSDWVGDISA